MAKTEKKLTNYQTAIYIAKRHGTDFSDEQLTKIAQQYGLKPKVLIKNFRSVCSIREIVKLLNEPD